MYLIMAGKTIASPDHINTRLIAFGEILLGNCLSSVSSNASKITGFLGYRSFIFFPSEIGS